MKTKTNAKTHLDFITPGLATSAVRRGWKRYAPRVTAEEREVLDTLQRNEELDEDLARSIVNSEASSFAREREKHIGEDYSNNASGGVHLSLEGRADETSERGEEAMHPATPIPPDSGGTPLEKHSPRSPAFRLDMGKLTANAMKHAQRPATVEEIEATLRRGREEYLRRYPKNVPPSGDE